MILRNFVIIILQIFLLSCGKHYVKQRYESEHYSLKSSAEQSVVSDSIKRFKIKVDSETQRILGESQDQLTKEGDENTLGNFVCEALMYSGKKQFPNDSIDLVVVNRGGLRTNLPKGEIKVLNIFELMPFDNELVLINISGEKLMEIYPLIMDKKHSFSGMRIKFVKGEVKSCMIGDKIIDRTKKYNLITSDYLANGGDNFVFLKAIKEIKRCDLKIRDAIINYCDYLTANKKQIISNKDGRLEISK